MRWIYLVFMIIILAVLGCEIPEEEPMFDTEAREKLLHCVPVREYATIEEDTSGQKQLSFYKVLRDTLTQECFERFVRSLKPKNQVYILGYVELSDFSRAGRGIYYIDPHIGPRLLQYQGARIVKRLVRGDSPWAIADDLGNPLLIDKINWGRILPGNDFVFDLDILDAVGYWGRTFDLPNTKYRIIGKEDGRVVVKGSESGEEGQRPNEIFIRQQAILEQGSGNERKISFFNVFEDRLNKKQRMHRVTSLILENQVYILGYERILPDLTAKGRGIFYVDPDSGAMLLEYGAAKIVKKIVKGDSQWKIAKALGNASLASKMRKEVIHPGDTLFVDFEILEAVGWSKQAFDLPNADYRIVGYTASEVVIKESDYTFHN